jgi:hypothetical protein
MIFFIDHQAHLLHAIDGNASSPLRVGVLPADELPFDEELPVDFLEVAHIDVLQALTDRHCGNPLP